jgi:hypothetical protein
MGIAPLILRETLSDARVGALVRDRRGGVAVAYRRAETLLSAE